MGPFNADSSPLWVLWLGAEDGVPQAELLGAQLGVLRQRGGAWIPRFSPQEMLS